MASEIPAGLVMGSLQVSFEQFSFPVPRVIPFPFTSALVLPQGDAEQKRLAHCLLLRLLSALPPGQVELTLIDPLQQGQSVEPFLPLLKVEQLVPQGHVLTRSDELEATLGKLTDEIEEMIQQRFNEKASNWSECNAINPNAPLPYKAVVIFDAPEQTSEKSLWFLGRVCENGLRCGVLPIIAIDSNRMEDRRYEKFRARWQPPPRGLIIYCSAPELRNCHSHTCLSNGHVGTCLMALWQGSLKIAQQRRASRKRCQISGRTTSRMRRPLAVLIFPSDGRPLATSRP